MILATWLACAGDVAELTLEAPLVEPVDVGQRGEFDMLDVALRALAADQLGVPMATAALHNSTAPAESVDRWPCVGSVQR